MKKHKTFNICKTQFSENLCESTEGKIRVYQTKSGFKYPSITSVLANAMSEEKKYILEKWAEGVGEDVANKVKEDAAERGTGVHDLLEKYILNDNTFQDTYKNSTRRVVRLFEQIKVHLDLKVDNIRLLEKPLYSDKLKVAGKVDMIAEFNGKLSVIDFKTSTKIKNKDDVLDYFIQETFYAIAYEEHFGEKVEQIVTLISTECGLKAVVFIEIPENYKKQLKEKVMKFYGL